MRTERRPRSRFSAIARLVGGTSNAPTSNSNANPNKISKGIKAKSKVPKNPTLFPRAPVGGLQVHATTAGLSGNDIDNQVNVFVVDRLQKMKKGVISRIPKDGNLRRTKDEKNSNKIALNRSMASTDRSDVALFLKSAMDFGPLDQSRPYLAMKRAAGEETGASGFPDLGWYFQSLATEAQKRFEVKKTQRFLTNHGHSARLRRSSYSFMDTELEAGSLKVHVLNKRLKRQKQYIYRPGRKRYHNVRNQGTTRMITSVEYDNHPSIVKLEGFGSNEIVINFSLTPLGSVMFASDLFLLPQYYMIGKFIQYHGLNEELLLRYLNIQSDDLKKDMKRKGIVQTLTNETSNQLPRQSVVNLDNNKEDNIAVKWLDDDSIRKLLLKLAEFFASSLMQGGHLLQNTRNVNNKIVPNRNEINRRTDFRRNDSDKTLEYFEKLLKPIVDEKAKLRSNPYETLLTNIHSRHYDGKNKKSFKNLTGKRIESVDFRQINKRNINEAILPERFDKVKQAFLEAITAYSTFLDAEYNLRKYYKYTESGQSTANMDTVPQAREEAFLKKEQHLRRWEELLLVRNMSIDCKKIRAKLELESSKDLLARIRKGDESAMFTNPYTDRSTLFRNMNLNNKNNTYKRVLSNGIYIDDSQFVFDYLSRKHLTLKARIQQYSRYLQLLSKYSIIRHTQIESFYNSAKTSVNNPGGRNASAEIIVKCDFLISKIIDAVNQYNEWFSKSKFKNRLSFTRHLGGKRISNGSREMNHSFMDSSSKKSQIMFDKEKYDYIYFLFEALVSKYIKALDDTRNEKANATNVKIIDGSLHAIEPSGKPIRVLKGGEVQEFAFARGSTYRELLTKMQEAPFTQQFYQHGRSNKKNQKKEAIRTEVREQRRLIPFLQEGYYPLVHAFQSSGFADQFTVNGRGYASSKKIESDFKSIYSKGELKSNMKMIMMYDFLQLISGIDKSRLVQNHNSPLTEKEIGYDLFQGGEFHKTFGMVFSPFLPAYGGDHTPLESKPFSVLSILGTLDEDNFRISWPVQLYGREGDSDLPGRMSKRMLKMFTFAEKDFDLVTTKSAGKYLTGYGELVTPTGNEQIQLAPPTGSEQIQFVSKTVKNIRGSDVPLHGVPYVTSDQLKGDRYFIGRSRGDKSNTKFHVGGIKARTWIRSSSDLHLKTKDPLVNSSIFTFQFDPNLETKLKQLFSTYNSVSDNRKLPTSWRTDDALKNTKDLIKEEYGPLHIKQTKMTYDKILEHTKTVQNDIIKNSTKTAKLLFPSFTWQNMIILYSKKLKSGPNTPMENENNMRKFPVLTSLAMRHVDTDVVDKYFKKIVTDFMYASVYVARSSGNEWCAAQYLPFIDKKNNTEFQTRFAGELTNLGLNVYGVHQVGANNSSIYLWLPVALHPNPDHINHGETKERVVDGESQHFYKEYNVMIQEEGDNGYTISSCSWFRRPLSSNVSNVSNVSGLRSTSNFGNITQPNTPSKFEAAKHSDDEWAHMLDLHRVSARCFSKAAALQQMFEGTENTRTKQKIRSWKRVVQYAVLQSHIEQPRLARSLRRRPMRGRSQGSMIAGPPKLNTSTRAASTRTLPTRKGRTLSALKKTSRGPGPSRPGGVSERNAPALLNLSPVTASPSGFSPSARSARTSRNTARTSRITTSPNRTTGRRAKIEPSNQVPTKIEPSSQVGRGSRARAARVAPAPRQGDAGAGTNSADIQLFGNRSNRSNRSNPSSRSESTIPLLGGA